MAVDLPENVTGMFLGYMQAAAQRSNDDAIDLRREMHLTHQTSKQVGGAMAYRLAAEAGSGRTRIEANEAAGGGNPGVPVKA